MAGGWEDGRGATKASEMGMGSPGGMHHHAPHGPRPPAGEARGGASGGASGGGAGARGSAVKVVVRVRPLSQAEMARGETETLEVGTDQRSLSVHVPGPRGSVLSRQFQFNACLPPTTTQPEVISKCGVHRLLDSALRGYASTIIAYGQTGSGKTFSMSGREEVIERQGYQGSDDDGVITRSMAHLFATIGKANGGGDGVTHTLRASYLEIHNEAIYDLLSGDNATQLQVRWEPQGGFYVQNLRAVECDRLEDALAIVSEGTRNRRVGSHELNKDSSRSHSIMTVHVETTAVRDGISMSKFGKVSFVDLAGSERLKASKSEGAMIKETGSINRSLFMLGKVIAMLGDDKSGGGGGGRGGQTHIPYRDSKLTKLLMDSLGGSSLALMIACCSPSPSHVEETLSTLDYASRARNIVNTPSVQQDPREQLIGNLRNEVELLRKENTYLRQQLQLGGRSVTPLGSGTTTPALDGRPRSGRDSDASGRGSRGSSRGGRIKVPPLALPHHGDGPNGSTHGTPAASPMGGKVVPGSRRGMAAVRKGSANLQMGSPQKSQSETSIPGHKNYGGAGDVDLEFAGLSRSDLTNRVKRAEELLQRYTNENARLADENDSLRGGKQLLEMEHRGVVSENEELTARLASLEYSFMNQEDGAADTFGFADEASTLALTSGFPDFPGVGKSTAKKVLFGMEGDEEASGGKGGLGRKAGPRGRSSKPRAVTRGLPPPR